jgi:hypothetical protein
MGDLGEGVVRVSSSGQCVLQEDTVDRVTRVILLNKIF